MWYEGIIFVCGTVFGMTIARVIDNQASKWYAKRQMDKERVYNVIYWGRRKI